MCILIFATNKINSSKKNPDFCNFISDNLTTSSSKRRVFNLKMSIKSFLYELIECLETTYLIFDLFVTYNSYEKTNLYVAIQDWFWSNRKWMKDHKSDLRSDVKNFY